MEYTELNTYVRMARQKGVSEAEMKRDLRSAGWLDRDIDLAIRKNPLIPPPKPPEGYRGAPVVPGGMASISSPTMWDAFEHVLMFISLYVLATAFALVLHLFVDRWIPGVPDNPYRDPTNAQLGMLRGYMAALIVSYPLFSFFFLRISGRTAKNPLIRAIPARKFLIYLTLVVAFLIVTGNIVSMIYTFLNGNVTLNFFLHFLVTTSVSGAVFAYYLQQVKEDRAYA
ncbi:MAG: DUF5671 domain-containing protein [Patescibacteria group bacterium]|nr:DUF5671 domain-containing protein [Patescibacteria group bacterium]